MNVLFVTAVIGSVAGILAEDAVPISCGQTVKGSTVGKPNIESYYPSGEVSHKLVLDEKSDIVATTCLPGTDYDSVVGIFSDAGLKELMKYNENSDDCASNELAAELRPDTLEAGTYYIAVGGHKDAEGMYELKVTCTAA